MPRESAPTTTAPLRQPTAAEPLRLWVGGDSMAQDFGAAVERVASSRGTFTPTLDYRISTGLTRPDYFNWPVHLRDDVLPTDPEVMVVMFGANDAQPLEVDGTVRQVSDPEWQAEYRRRVGTTMDLLRSAEAGGSSGWASPACGPPTSTSGWGSSTTSTPRRRRSGRGSTSSTAGPCSRARTAATPPTCPVTTGNRSWPARATASTCSRFGADRLAEAVFDVIDGEMDSGR